MAKSPSLVSKRNHRPNRRTRDLVLLEMLADHESGEQRTQVAIGQKLGCERNTVNGHLSSLAKNDPPLTYRDKHGNWFITSKGIEEARRMQGRQNEIPIIGKIAAGPALAVEQSDVLDFIVQGVPIDLSLTPFESLMLPGLDPQEHFAMVVDGESMLQAHICPGDMVIFRYATGWDGWDGVRPGDIIAAAVPEGADVHREDWLERLLAAQEFAGDVALNGLTLKQLDQSMRQLQGRYGNIQTIFRPLGILIQLLRDYKPPH